MTLRRLLIACAFVPFCALLHGQGAPVPLTCSTPADSTLAPLGFDVYSLSAQSGDSVWVRVLSTSGASFVPNVALVDARNQAVPARPTPFVVGFNQIDPMLAGATFAAVYDLAAAGSYHIQIQNPGSNPNSYRIVFVWLNKPCSSTLSCGASAFDQITTKLQTSGYSFAAKAGDLLNIRLARVGVADPAFDVAVFVFGPDGHLMSTHTSSGTGQLAAADTLSNNPTGFIVQPATDGTVTMVIFDPDDLTGTFALSISRLNGPCGSNTLNCASPTVSKIANPMSTDSYSVTLSAGDPVVLRTAAVDSNAALLPVLTIFDPQGNAVDLGAIVANGPHSLVHYAFNAKASGTYTILAQDGSKGLINTGSYAISILRPNQPCSNAQGLSCDPVNATVNGILGSVAYTVSAQAKQPVILRLLRSNPSTSFVPHLDVYDALGGTQQSLDATDLTRGTFTPAAAGTYLLVVSDSSDGTQSGSFTLSALPANGACATATLSCGRPAAGAFSKPLAASVYSYSASSGESFSVRLADNTGALQPVLEVYDSHGASVGQNVPGNVTGVDVTAPAGGAYTIIATDASKRPVGGPFGIDLLRTVNACGVTPPVAQTAIAVVETGNPYVSYTIPASTGDVLSVRSASFTPSFSAQMDLYDPTGARLDSATFGLSRKVSLAGNYTVIVGAAAPRSSGTYSFSWQLLNRPAATSLLACGGSATASLTASSEFRYYSVSATAGDLMRLVFTRLSDNFSPQMELFDPAGTRLTQTSDVSQKASATGSFLVVVSPSTSNGETGAYAVSYQRANNPCSPSALTCGQTALRQVTVPGQLDALTFTGTGGDTADLKFAQRSGNYAPQVELYDSTGSLLAGSTASQVRSKLASSGTFNVLVHDRAGVNTGSYRVSLQDDTNTCTVNDTEPPAITLLQPTGGEVIMGGAPYNIQWLSDDNVGVATHDVSLSTDGGTTFPTVIASGLGGNTQAYNWTVPPEITPGRKAVIRVTATDAAGNATPAASGLLSIIGSGFTPNSSATYTYDALNRLLQGNLGDGRTLQFTWDAAGNLVSIAVTGQ
ncbi:MAG TPA: RHS repeat domain-containing protein [Bryobacteraceae bacterium]|nr:RHS repeat domain-containing protein [Bryobacteraceae bacterium]